MKSKLTIQIICLALIAFVSITMLFTSCKKDSPPAPVVNFTFTGENIPAPCEIVFANTCTNATSYIWEFGDGTNTTEQNTKHTYTKGGIFTITLTAKGEGGSNSANKEIVIKNPVPVANFTFTGNNNAAPCEVSFLNSSTNAASYEWEFGDGTTSVEKDTKHTYTSGGNYTVILTAKGDGGSNSTSKDINIKTPDPVANFTYTGGNFTAPCTVSFLNASTNATSFQWEFGDGSVSTLNNPTHTYTYGGTFSVKLIATGEEGGSSSLSKDVIIESPVPVADFDYTGGNCTAPCEVSFFNASTNAASFLWEFGDGDVSTLINPTHTYTYGGAFYVTLVATGNGGSNSVTRPIIIENSDIYTDVTFNNPVYTDIYVTLNGSTKIISPNSSVTFYSVPNGYESFYAYTMGTTTSGTQIGLKIEWSNTILITGGTYTLTLIITSDYFFLYMKNYGSHNLTPLYVNYGLSSQTTDNILIPNNSTKYRIGYYRAWSNTEVRAYYQDMPTYYTYWININFPWTNNQSVELSNSFKELSGMDENHLSFSSPELAPAYKNSAIKSNFDKSAINEYCK